jgi:reductive dehalogenase
LQAGSIADPAVGRKLAETNEAWKGKGYKFRDQRKRYPWWVKSVDKMTTETDDAVSERPATIPTLVYYTTDMENYLKRKAKGRARMIENINNNIPGWQIQDIALMYASRTYLASGQNKTGTFSDGQERIAEIVASLIVTPDELGVPRWQGSEERASRIVEAAGIHLGAAQVAFTAINTHWMHGSVNIDPLVNEVTVTKEGLTLIPERYKYVVVMSVLTPQAVGRCAPSPLGGASDGVGNEGWSIIRERMKNFIKCLGYGAINIPLFMNPLPFAVAAGLGEMGRMNRMISPLYGGGLYLSAVITDLPLALDKPIDFGLQEFCKHCKLCAEACPGRALSMEKEPSWEPRSIYTTKGKKVYSVDLDKCQFYCHENPNYCGTCMNTCCWTKEKTLLHNIMRVIGSRLPFASGVMSKMEKVFGYGPVPKNKREDWWEMRLPTKGVNSYNAKRS